MVLRTHGASSRRTGTGVFDFIFWPFRVNSAFWRGRALHSIVVTSPWPGEEHSREVANSNEKKRGGVMLGPEGGLWMAGSGRESCSLPPSLSQCHNNTVALKTGLVQ